jgi:hypothetical protein
VDDVQFEPNNSTRPGRDTAAPQPDQPARERRVSYGRNLAAYVWRVPAQYLVSAEPPVPPPTPRRGDEPETVEDIIARGYFAAPPTDPITGLIEDRNTTARLGLDDMIAQVRGRYVVWWLNHQDIERAKLAATNALHDWAAYFGPPGVELHATVHQTLQRLYQQQRDERTHLWRDVSRLRLALPEAAQQYLSAYRQLRILNEPGGDPPC